MKSGPELPTVSEGGAVPGEKFRIEKATNVLFVVQGVGGFFYWDALHGETGSNVIPPNRLIKVITTVAGRDWAASTK